MPLGHKIHGSGDKHVIVLPDWSSDTRSYDTVLPYLDTDTYTYVFADQRGYGLSKDMDGDMNATEIASDILLLANHLGWDRFHLIGHSMNGMSVQMASHMAPERIISFIAITPISAAGMQPPQEGFEFFSAVAKDGADEMAFQGLSGLTSNQYLPAFTLNKIKHWRACSTEKARLAYLKMFAYEDFSKDIKGMKTPCLVIAGKYDTEGIRLSDMKETFGKWLPNCELIEMPCAGHYPMQETPVALATLVEDFLGKH